MKQISVKMLQAGSIYTEPVYIEGDNLLVPAGIAIRKKDIDQLISWGIETVSTEGEIGLPGAHKGASPGPAAGNTAKLSAVPSLVEAPEHQGTYRIYTSLIEELKGIFSNIAAEARVDAWAIDAIISRILQVVREHRDLIIGYILAGEVKHHDLAKSSVNTAILSCLITMEFKAPNHKLLQIVSGALLHDVGMLRLPREILNKKGGLSDIELQRMQTHPLLSYKIACKELLYPDGVGLVVLQHHEHWDGTGYPRGLTGTQIDAGARIVSVADAFEAMVSQKPYRNSIIGYQAMKNLLADNSRRFDPNVLKAFIKTMGIYPIGSIVLLNNGAIARVTDVRTDTPLRPKIRLLISESGKVYPKNEGETIDLLAEKKLFIVRALDPKDLTKPHE
ncbi:MAG: HD-GYP domain-containing protein [Spirochaetaceae bacterium]|jgi:HD-GYP domain-containing protein (c-di-GMP phosphodiesterase class II)|nr:HD-GYP domain-containing protein [Spirochaetaceae bacterium]